MNDRKSFIAEILPKAAKYLIDRGPRKYTYTYNKGYLSEADTLVHEFITNSIHKNFPNSLVYSEEGEILFSHRQQNDSYIWILDPICGTMNFVYNIPFYVHSLSVMDKDGVFYAGIYDMNQNELFLADRFETTLNGARVSTSQTKNLNEALVAVNCNQSAWMGESLTIADLASKFAPPVTRRIHILESANLEMAYVACGRLDAYVNPDDKVWDIAAGSLMIASAGGETKTLEGSVTALSPCRGVIATNKYLLDSILLRLEA